MKVRFKEKGKKKSSPFRQNGTERLRDRLTGPHAAHLPGCQEFRFTLGGTSPSTAISREGQTAFPVQRMRSSRAPEASLCAMMPALPKPPPIPRLCPHSQSKIITLYYRLQKWASKHSPTGLHPERRNAPEWAFMTARFHFRHSRPAVFAKKNPPPGCQKFEKRSTRRPKGGGARRRCSPEMAQWKASRLLDRWSGSETTI